MYDLDFIKFKHLGDLSPAIKVKAISAIEVFAIGDSGEYHLSFHVHSGIIIIPCKSKEQAVRLKNDVENCMGEESANIE